MALKEYDWLRDLVEIMEKDTNPEHFLEYTKLQMFQDNVFCFTPKGEVIKLPRGATAIDFAYAVHTKIGDTLKLCEINGRGSPNTKCFKKWRYGKNYWIKKYFTISSMVILCQNRKARAAIRRYWQNKKNINQQDEKNILVVCVLKYPMFQENLVK